MTQIVYDGTHFYTEDIIRFAMQGTNQTLDGYVIDRVNLSNGKFEAV